MSKIAFLFPGQGAQQVGMGRQAFDSSPAVREMFDRANELLGYDLAELCFEGPADDLNSTVHSQPALFVCSLAGLQVLREQSPDAVEGCELVAGLSLGEYTAIVCAGVLDFETGLTIVKQRGLAMQAASDAAPSGMVTVIGLESDRLQQVIEQTREQDEILQIANYLCAGTLVVSGAQAACQRLESAALAAGAMKVVPIAVSGAFHTPYMQPAIEPLERAIRAAPFAKPRIPVVLNVDAQPHSDPESIRERLIQQVVSPVQWEQTLRHLLDAGCDRFYEVGPGRVLRGLLKRVSRKVPCESVTV